MITCSVCGTTNDDLAVICTSCKSYLQAKVDTLDLFHTAWGLIESPRSAFRRIVLSRHKNYVLLLSSLVGMSVVYTVLWFKNLGHYFPNVLALSGVGLLVGPPLGVVLTFIVAWALHRISRALKGKVTMRDMYAVVAYATVPASLALVFVYPIEIAIFGLYFFDNNPPPLVINPVAYLTLLGFDAASAIWSWFLLVEGMVVANGFARKKAFLVTVCIIAVTALAGTGLRFM